MAVSVEWVCDDRSKYLTEFAEPAGMIHVVLVTSETEYSTYGEDQIVTIHYSRKEADT